MSDPILDMIANDPNIDPAFRAAIKSMYTEIRARLGRRRQYLWQHDADAYDRGYGDYVFGDAPVMDQGPYSDGQWDRFSEEEERAMASLEVEYEPREDEHDRP